MNEGQLGIGEELHVQLVEVPTVKILKTTFYDRIAELNGLADRLAAGETIGDGDVRCIIAALLDDVIA